MADKDTYTPPTYEEQLAMIARWDEIPRAKRKDRRVG